MAQLTRRTLIRGAAGLAGALTVGGAAACGRSEPTSLPPRRQSSRPRPARRSPAGRVVTARLSPRPATVDLGGRQVRTWAYGDTVPGPLLRARAGDLLRVTVDNRFPPTPASTGTASRCATTWTASPASPSRRSAPASEFTYGSPRPTRARTSATRTPASSSTAACTRRWSSTTRPSRGDYDAEWVVVLDDWVDGVGRTPDQVLRRAARRPAALRHRAAMGDGTMGGMGGTGTAWAWAGMGAACSRRCSAGTPATSPTRTTWSTAASRPRRPSFAAGRASGSGSGSSTPAADTAFRVALGGHRLTVTHTDGFPVVPAAGGRAADRDGRALRRPLTARRRRVPAGRLGRGQERAGRWPWSAPARGAHRRRTCSRLSCPAGFCSAPT